MTIPYSRQPDHQPTDPHLALAAGVLLGAVKDIQRGNKRAGEAARWLKTDDADQYCAALNIDHESIKRWLDQRTNQPAQAGLTNHIPLRTNGKEHRNMTDQPTNPPEKSIVQEMDELDAEGQAELLKLVRPLIVQLKAIPVKRAADARQAALKAQMEAELKQIPNASSNQRAILRAKYRRVGLKI